MFNKMARRNRKFEQVSSDCEKKTSAFEITSWHSHLEESFLMFPEACSNSYNFRRAEVSLLLPLATRSCLQKHLWRKLTRCCWSESFVLHDETNWTVIRLSEVTTVCEVWSYKVTTILLVDYKITDFKNYRFFSSSFLTIIYSQIIKL